MNICYFCDQSLDEDRRDVTSCGRKYVHPECASRFCGKERKCCSCPWPKEGMMLLKSFMEWCEVRHWTGGFKSRVRCTIPSIDHEDGFYYEFIAVGEKGEKTYLHSHEDLWMHFLK